MNSEKIVLAPAYLHQQICQFLLEENGGPLGNLKLLDLNSYAHRLIPVSNRDSACIMEASQRIHRLEGLSCYGSMRKYPAFLFQIIDFYRLMLRYEIGEDDLPASTIRQQELKTLLCALKGVPFSDIPLSQLQKKAEEDSSALTIFHYPPQDLYESRILDTLEKRHKLYAYQSAAVKNRTFFKALNPRQEVEAACQYIISQNLPADHFNVILADSSEYIPIVRQVFERYHLPFQIVQERRSSSFVQGFAALVLFLQKRTLATFRNAYQLTGFLQKVSSPFLEYLETLTDLDQLLVPFCHFENSAEDMEVLDYFRKKQLLTLEKKACAAQLELLPFIEKLFSVPQDNYKEILAYAFTVMKQHRCMKNAGELQAASQVKSITEECAQYLKTEQDMELLIAMLQKVQLSLRDDKETGCIVTDLAHPTAARTHSILLGADQNHYPGFQAAGGIFDEEYLASFDCLLQKDRYSLLQHSLAWIEGSGEQLVYSFAYGDYAGKNKESSFEIEQLAGMKPQLWPLISRSSKTVRSHVLNPELARRLFIQNQQIHGSISSIEKYFRCPYSYFLQYGLKLRSADQFEINAAFTGTLQHTLLEEAIRRYKKQYASIQKEELKEISDPHFISLIHLFPNMKHELEQLQRRMLKNIEAVLSYLQDMESNTSFEPAYLEYRFEMDWLTDQEISLHLKGIMDRIDLCQDHLRILDYKSSSRQLRMKDVEAGLQLQLCTYLISACSLLDKKPMGAYYCILNNPTLSPDAGKLNLRSYEYESIGQDQWDEEWIKERKLLGWTFDDPAILDYDGRHIQGLSKKNQLVSVKKMSYPQIQEKITALYRIFTERLMAGDIAVDPIKGSCEYCDFKAVCRFKGIEREAVPLIVSEGGLDDGDAVE